MSSGDAQSLPLPDASMDYAFANMFLHHVEHPGKASREMACIQKPGGKLIITDLDEHCFVFLTTEHHDRWMGFNRDDIRQWCLAADLRQVNVDCAGANCCAQSGCGDVSAQISIFLAHGIKG